MQPIRHHLEKRSFVLLFLLLAETACGRGALPVAPPARPEGAATGVSSTAAKSIAAWPGRLETESFYIHAPPSINDLEPTPDQTPLWRFRGGTITTVGALLTRADVPTEMTKALLGTAVGWRENGGITLVPTPEMILGMPPKSRQRVYEELAKSPSNPYHAAPLLIPDYLLDDWFQHSRLSDVQRERMRRLFWRRGTCYAFSDISLMVQAAASASEIRHCREALSLTRAIMVKVRLPPAEGLDAAIEYWKGTATHPDISPYVHAVAEASGIETIDLIHLLPPLARRWLYTFPALSSGVGGRFPDCSWTSLNFFATRPEPYYLDSHSSFLEMRQNYERIDAPAKLGDLICFTDKAGQIFHTCVYIAEDIIFTKNGAGLASPWLLMPLRDVEAYYRWGDTSEIAYFRKKPRTDRDE